ncbi:MAG: hypothetical protein J5552_13170 [Prevotella sp.]|nr:hypothetical protein [Prevotella sp.]
MKKVALLFAAATLLVACAEEPKKKQTGATQEQKDSIYESLKAAYMAEAESVQPKFELHEGETVIDSAACIAEAEEIKAAIIASADTTNPLVKAQLRAIVKDFEENLKAEEEAAQKAKEK